MLIETNHIDQLSLDQKVELLEKVSMSLEKNMDEFESPSWHQDVLESRAESMQKPETWITLQELKKSLYE